MASTAVCDDTGHVRSVTVHVTEGCNLACEYCFSKDVRSAAAMTEETASRFVDWVCGQAGEGKYAVTFFGGEPFLKPGLMRYIVEAIEERKPAESSFSFGATSNGTLIKPEQLPFLKEHRVAVMLSTDGDRPSHNRFRVHPGGRGSYDEFLAGLGALKTVQPHLTARLTFTPETVGLLCHNHECLFLEHGFDSVAATPVAELAWDDASLDIFEDQLYQLTGLLLELWGEGKFVRIRILEKEITDLLHQDDGDGPRYPCGAGRTMAGVGPDGRIYPCHRFVGIDEFACGSVDDGIHPERRREFWTSKCGEATTCSPSGCADCEFDPVCRGECYHVCLVTNGDIKHPPPSHRHLKSRTVKVGGSLLNHLLEKEPKLLERMLRYKKGSLESVLAEHEPGCV